jgi:multidrug efflux pump subunit AcrB
VSKGHQSDLLGLFAQHPVAANLLMLVLLLSGAFALLKLNVQFFPDFELERVSIRTLWRGASAEDVESSITNRLENELRGLSGLYRQTSSSADGVSAVTLEFLPGTQMSQALDEVKDRVALVRALPAEAETPEVSRVINYEQVARLVLRGQARWQDLAQWARRFERELLARGISRVDLSGLPEQEMVIELPLARLHELNLSLSEVAAQIGRQSLDLPAGTLARDQFAQQLRGLSQGRGVRDFGALEMRAADGRLLRLADIAVVRHAARDGQLALRHNGSAAIELSLLRSKSADSLKNARLLQSWLEEVRPTLPPSLELTVFDESWQLIWERISLLLKNGAGGLILVVVALYLFLNGRVAFWVAWGIPVAFMATLAVLYAAGGSINMISLFAMIMMLGVIVDDAIVVGEDALAHYQMGERSLLAAEGGARRMLAPVMASSLTTMAAFIPLMTLSGTFGKLLSAIPLLVICALIASLVECFLILPAHLRQSFHALHHRPEGPLRRKLDARFAAFRDGRFRVWVAAAVDRPWVTVSIALALLLLTVGLFAGGRMKFTFFPSPESNTLNASVSFAAGTPRARVEQHLVSIEAALREAERELGGGLLRHVQTRIGQGAAGAGGSRQAEHLGSLVVELTRSEERSVRNTEIIDAWRRRIPAVAGLDSLVLESRRAGPPGRDITVRLTGRDSEALKSAAERLAAVLEAMPGVSGVEDDLPWGQEQRIYRLTPEGRALGFSIEDVGRQLRDAYEGRLVQIYQQGDEEMEVRVRLPDRERGVVSHLDSLPLRTPGGGFVPLATAAEFSSRRGFEALRHAEGLPAVEVSANVNSAVNNTGVVMGQLAAGALPELERQYGVRWSFEGRLKDQADTLRDMLTGVALAAALIYIVLAWVFGSWSWPLAVMIIIPFGLAGAVFGHQVMGMDLTILSLFGLFGLSGIAVNDSIVLTEFFKHAREQGMGLREALIEASTQRLRAVLLTSLTTIGGLLPLVLETSTQAQFLIPMAVSISFGLMFTTGLVLFLVPALLYVFEDAKQRMADAPLQPASAPP